MRQSVFKVGLAFSGCLALQSALAGGPETPEFLVPMTPGVSVAGNFVDFNSGWADALVPVFRTTPNSFLYLDPQGLYHNNDQYSASIGGGFRMLTQSAGILGAYVFGDYNHSQQSNSYWFVSPGLERLGDTLDFSVNGYFPISSQRNNTTSGFASQFGNTDDIVFSGHNEIDTIVQNFESTGVGVDGEIGYRLPFLHNNTKLYLGGYYFSPKDNDSITGGIAKLEVPVNNLLSLTVSDAYDNIFHNTFRAGASLSLWGRSTHFYNHSVETRMVDPVQRNRIAQEGHSGTDQYITEGQEDIGTGILLSNIWFFAPGGTPGPLLTDTSAATPTAVSFNQCTAEHPCAAVDVNTNFFGGINLIAPNAKMFLAPGTYSTLSDGSTFGKTLALNPGQSMYGRSADYKLSAVGDNRALLIGDVNLFSNNILNSLRLANDGTQAQGVVVENNANTVILNNVLIGNTGSNPLSSYLIGMLINNNSQVFISNSEIDVFVPTGSGSADFGVSAVGSHNSVQIDHSTINAVNNSSNVDSGAIKNEVVATHNDWILTNNQIASSGSNMNTIDELVDISSNNPSSNNTWDLMNNQIVTTGTCEQECIGINSQNNSVGNIWNLTNNQITVSNTTGHQPLSGILTGGGHNNTWRLMNNIITVVASSSSISGAYGIQLEADTNGSWTLINNKITVSAVNTSDNRVGILAAIVNNDVFLLENNQINVSVTNSGAGGLIAGIFDGGTNNTWTLSGNRISTLVSGNSETAIGIHTQFSTNGTWILTGNTIEAQATAGNSAATGILFGGSDRLTSSQDTILTASMSGAASGIFNQGSSIINLVNDSIQSHSSTGNAIGLNDPTNSGQWTYDSATFAQIQVSTSPPGIACKTLFGAVCNN